MGIISFIYNSGYNTQKLFLGEQEINLAYLGEQIVFNEVIDDLSYILCEFYKEKTLSSTIEAPVKSAILKGSTKYRDIDTGDILDTFDETKNLELVSVKMPVLTTSNEDGTKTNILTVNEEVELRGIGNVKDELNCLTGELTQRIGEVVLDGSEDENWYMDMLSNNDTRLNMTFKVDLDNIINYDRVTTGMLCDRFIQVTGSSLWTDDIQGVGSANGNGVKIGIPKSNLETQDVNGFRYWLSQNPVTVQYQLATESIKTVDLSSNKVYAYNGTTRYTCSSEEGSLIPTACIEVPVETEAVE